MTNPTEPRPALTPEQIAQFPDSRALRRMSACPYCHSSLDLDAQGTRYYECGTRCVTDPNVRYIKGCRK